MYETMYSIMVLPSLFIFKTGIVTTTTSSTPTGAAGSAGFSLYSAGFKTTKLKAVTLPSFEWDCGWAQTT